MPDGLIDDALAVVAGLVDGQDGLGPGQGTALALGHGADQGQHGVPIRKHAQAGVVVVDAGLVARGQCLVERGADLERTMPVDGLDFC